MSISFIKRSHVTAVANTNPIKLLRFSLPFISGAPQKEVYFMGLIDVLTQYDTKKKAAHAAKTVKHGVSNIRQAGIGWRGAVCSHVMKCMMWTVNKWCWWRFFFFPPSFHYRRLVLKSPRSTPSSTPNDFVTSSQTFLHNTQLWTLPQELKASCTIDQK